VVKAMSRVASGVMICIKNRTRCQERVVAPFRLCIFECVEHGFRAFSRIVSNVFGTFVCPDSEVKSYPWVSVRQHNGSDHKEYSDFTKKPLQIQSHRRLRTTARTPTTFFTRSCNRTRLYVISCEAKLLIPQT
jgi:hypothetical protein